MWAVSGLQDCSAEEKCSKLPLFSLLCWFLWRGRNKWVHENGVFNAKVSMAKAMSFLKSYENFRLGNKSVQKAA